MRAFTSARRVWGYRDAGNCIGRGKRERELTVTQMSTFALEDQAVLVLEVCIACALGAIIGWERDRAGKNAGIRTHVIIAASSAFAVGLGELAVSTGREVGRVVWLIVDGAAHAVSVARPRRRRSRWSLGASRIELPGEAPPGPRPRA